jgi:hemerythrin-like domain-containing protein
MSHLIDALRQEHSDLSELLDIIDREINGSGEPDLDLLHEVLEYCLTYPDQYHHPKEDLIYRALARHDRQIEPAIEDLEAEHEELSELTKELAGVVEDARTKGKNHPAGLRPLAQSFLDYYRQHISKEEHWFFPDALKLLEPSEWAEIEAEVQDPTDPLFKEQAAERLLGLTNRSVN